MSEIDQGEQDVYANINMILGNIEEIEQALYSGADEALQSLIIRSYEKARQKESQATQNYFTAKNKKELLEKQLGSIYGHNTGLDYQEKQLEDQFDACKFWEFSKKKYLSGQIDQIRSIPKQNPEQLELQIATLNHRMVKLGSEMDQCRENREKLEKSYQLATHKGKSAAQHTLDAVENVFRGRGR